MVLSVSLNTFMNSSSLSGVPGLGWVGVLVIFADFWYKGVGILAFVVFGDARFSMLFLNVREGTIGVKSSRVNVSGVSEMIKDLGLIDPCLLFLK
jgi:hypothetical protein